MYHVAISGPVEQSIANGIMDAYPQIDANQLVWLAHPFQIKNFLQNVNKADNWEREWNSLSSNLPVTEESYLTILNDKDKHGRIFRLVLHIDKTLWQIYQLISYWPAVKAYRPEEWARMFELWSKCYELAVGSTRGSYHDPTTDIIFTFLKNKGSAPKMFELLGSFTNSIVSTIYKRNHEIELPAVDCPRSTVWDEGKKTCVCSPGNVWSSVSSSCGPPNRPEPIKADTSTRVTVEPPKVDSEPAKVLTTVYDRPKVPTEPTVGIEVPVKTALVESPPKVEPPKVEPPKVEPQKPGGGFSSGGWLMVALGVTALGGGLIWWNSRNAGNSIKSSKKGGSK
jgi:hypothetical protein